jgi:hypothetical protein
MANKRPKSKVQSPPPAAAAKLGHRPTDYKPEMDAIARQLCLLGAKDSQLAEAFDIAESTLNLWKKKHPTFMESLKGGKLQADAAIVQSLYSRAMGMTVEEEQAVKVKAGDGIETVEVVKVKKTLPPDVTACIFWLKNRQPNLWHERISIERGKETADAAGGVPAEVIELAAEIARETIKRAA